MTAPFDELQRLPEPYLLRRPIPPDGVVCHLVEALGAPVFKRPHTRHCNDYVALSLTLYALSLLPSIQTTAKSENYGDDVVIGTTGQTLADRTLTDPVPWVAVEAVVQLLWRPWVASS